MERAWFAYVGCLALALGVLSTVYGQSTARVSQDDAQVQAKKFGLDYRVILKKAEQEPTSVRCLFLLAEGVFDGAGGESYDYDLMLLMKKWGDKKAVELLRSVQDPIRSRVLESLYREADGPFGGPSSAVWLKFKKEMPEVAAMCEEMYAKRKK